MNSSYIPTDEGWQTSTISHKRRVQYGHSYTDHQAKGIIEGTYTDYITDDLFSTDFKYIFKAE